MKLEEMQTIVAGMADSGWLWKGQRQAVVELFGWYQSASLHRDDLLKREAALKEEIKNKTKVITELRADYDKVVARNVELTQQLIESKEELRQAAVNEENKLAELTEAEKDARMALSQAQHVNKLVATKLKETAQELTQEKAWVKANTGDRYYRAEDNSWWKRGTDGVLYKAAPPETLMEVDELKRRIKAARETLDYFTRAAAEEIDEV